MPLNIWTQTTGYQFTNNGQPFPEQVSVNLPLPLIPAAGFNGVPPPSYDGTGHHPTVPLRNSAGSAFARYPVNSYTDGLHAMRTDLANARTVSNLVVWDQVNEGETADPTGYSGFMYAWGQFITHELASERTGGANIDVIVPPGDTNLTPGSHIPVSRAQVAAGTGINGIVALPINDVTGWIDGSVVYGIAYPPGVVPVSGFTNPVLLREGGLIATTGKLLTSSNGQYGPIVNGSFLFGDPRGTENPDLTSIQTLFIREHNWHVDQLRAANPSWTGEQLYQRARNIVIAEEQVITYKEWLPKIIGNDAISAYTGFKPEVDASIKIEFAAAALRFGHSIVSGAQDRVDEAGNITESLTLGQAFFLTPAQYERNGGANGFLRKLASDISNKLDVYIIEDLRNLLNDPPAALDLAATNIQRGRDLGLPSLNQMRVALGFSAYTSFSQITSDATTANALHSAYVNINDIDLWVGGLAEDRYPGAMVGPTFRAIIADQMSRLRDGDQSWYQNQPWNPTDLTWINNTTLSDIILRNTDTVHMQTDAFVAVERADLISGAVPSIVARSPSTSPPPLSDTAGITFTVISGSLPPGLILQSSTIIGSPYITQGIQTYNFCIRASSTAKSTAARFDAGKFIPGGTTTGTFLQGMTLTGSGIPVGTYIVSSNGDGTFAVNITKNIASVLTNGSGFADRTFTMQIDGANAPVFLTPAGNLPVGVHQQLYTLDSNFVAYQIEAFDLNTVLGAHLKYFIASGDGNLPPGLTLSDDGLISGYVLPNPQTVISVTDGSGAFDDTYFDDAGYDFAVVPTDGFDSYQYDDVTWDYSSNVRIPSTLNQNYQFKVTVSDGITSAQRIFKIFVLGTDQFRADSTSTDGFAGSFTADSSFLRNPVWLSKANLGTFRANNYVTVPVLLYDHSNVIFRLETTNCEIYAETKRLLLTDNIQALTILGNLTQNSNIVTNVANANAYGPGQSVQGDGIPPGTLINSVGADIPLTNVIINNTTGTFTCNYATSQMYVGQHITVAGQFSVSNTIANYTDRTISFTYYIIATNGFTSFTLSSKLNGPAVSTIAGTPHGVTFTANAFTLTLSQNATMTTESSAILIYGGTSLSIINSTGVPVAGQYFTFTNYVANATDKVYQISKVASLGDSSYRLTLSQPLEIAPPDLTTFYIGSLSKLPIGTSFDVNTGEVFGRVPYTPAITTSYTFTITAVRQSVSLLNTETVTSFKTFNITILGSVTSQITWNSPSYLGSIPAAYPSTLSISASSNVPSTTVLYYITSGSLPPGLSLTTDGEIVGTTNQYYNPSTNLLGLTTFDNGGTTFDSNATSVDRLFKFTVVASDSYQYSALPKTFTISVTSPNTVPYSNVYTQPFLAPTQRSAWRAFINNTAIFTPSSIYRTNDTSFGMQANLKMLVYAGIQTESAAAYVGAIGLGVKKKRFKFGSVKTAIAVDPNSGKNVYEVVYVQMLDPSEPDGLYPSASFNAGSVEPETITVDDSNSIWSTNLSDLSAGAPSNVRPAYEITVDSTGYEVSNPNTSTYYNNSITNWQKRLSQTTDHYITVNEKEVAVPALTERNYLPLWMRSIPKGSKAQMGYVLCVPICFCKPGTSAGIALNIKHSGFDFNTIDYTVDRFTISAVTGYASDKYLVFRDDRITV